jgi:hypothetical protein
MNTDLKASFVRQSTKHGATLTRRKAACPTARESNVCSTRPTLRYGLTPLHRLGKGSCTSQMASSRT